MTIDDVLRIAQESRAEVFTMQCTSGPVQIVNFRIEELLAFARSLLEAAAKVCDEAKCGAGPDDDQTDKAYDRALRHAAIGIRALLPEQTKPN